LDSTIRYNLDLEENFNKEFDRYNQQIRLEGKIEGIEEGMKQQAI
jgi:uncharacterized membrane protein